MNKKIEKWDTIGIINSYNLKIFNATMYRRKHPKMQKEGNFVVLDSPSWVNIIPITHDNHVILVEQYRHGSDSVTLEVPGGLVEPGEEPRIAAERECLEETGYKGEGAAFQIGRTLPNPAFMNNECYSFVWKGCEKVSEQQLDGNEDINVIRVPLNEIPEMILSGKINHSLVMNAFFYQFLKLNQQVGQSEK